MNFVFSLLIATFTSAWAAEPSDIRPPSISALGSTARTARLAVEHSLQCRLGVPRDADKFLQGVRSFRAGTLPPFEELEGSYPGRCFDFVNRALPRNSLLVVVNREGERKIMELGLYSRQAPLGFFYDASQGSADAETIQAAIALNWGSFTPVSNKGASWSSDVPSEGTQLRLRKHDHFLILSFELTRELGLGALACRDPAPTVGGTWGVCFYKSRN